MIMRKATSNDALDVWFWRNDPVTRAMSRVQEEVPRESHLSWFSGAVEDPLRTILIGEVNGEKVGMVRFDYETATEISININPKFRSSGHGYALLTEALKSVPGEVWAEIKDENLASQRLFERAGFQFHDTSEGLRRYLRPSD